MGQEKFHALSAVSTVIGAIVDMDDDEAGDRQLRDRLDKATSTFVAAAVPVEFGFTDAQSVHGLANLGNIDVLAQDGSK